MFHFLEQFLNVQFQAIGCARVLTTESLSRSLLRGCKFVVYPEVIATGVDILKEQIPFGTTIREYFHRPMPGFNFVVIVILNLAGFNASFSCHSLSS